MEVSQTMDTEEALFTCLHLRFYHPRQHVMGQFRQLPLGLRLKQQADDPLRLGRNGQLCTFALADTQVSRKQLAFQAYRTPHSPDMFFSVQNLSQRGRTTVNGSVLGYLEKMDLQDDKALIRFGEYEMVVAREPGEAKEKFEVELEVLAVSPSRETGIDNLNVTPVMDTGMCLCPPDLSSPGPLESDETVMFPSH